MEIFTSAFRHGDEIPPKYTCDGEDVSPSLEWAGVPAGARSLALIVDDPDAPRGRFVHWLIWGIAASEKGLTEGAGLATPNTAGARQGRNDFGKLGYGGPCPPGGTHRYQFTLYALDADLDVPAGAGVHEVEKVMAAHVLERAQLMGRYARRQPKR
jgi:Raf kinase inhibitor-like YbhB/YbcL family protein